MTGQLVGTVTVAAKEQFRPLPWWLRLLVLLGSVVLFPVVGGMLFVLAFGLAGTADKPFLRQVTGFGMLTGIALALVLGSFWRGTRWQTHRAIQAGKLLVHRHDTALKAAVVTPPPAPHPASAEQRSTWPTVLLTLLLSPAIGWIPALLQARGARSRGLPAGYFWKSYVAATLIWSGLAVLGHQIPQP